MGSLISLLVMSSTFQFTALAIESCCLVLIIPYTKVEESFNMQAMHDFLFIGFPRTYSFIYNLFEGSEPESEVLKLMVSGVRAANIHLPLPVNETYQKWDHEDFPGPVARTFVGSFVISLVSLPFMLIPFIASNKMYFQYICRMILGLFVIRGFNAFANAVGKKYGTTTRRSLVVLTMIQFHLMFYLSRPLPNTFALCLSLWSLSRWIMRDFERFLFLVAMTVVIFRFDSCILFGWIILYEVLITRQLSLWKVIKVGIPSGIFALMITVLFDSWMWGKWIWPEGEGLYFNLYLNKSNEWGTSPFLWYFYSALPKTLILSLLLVPFATKKCMINFCLLPLLFIFTYSFLPHKETRFIIYAIPMLNVCGANTIAILIEKYDGSKPCLESYLGNMILKRLGYEVTSDEEAEAADRERERRLLEEEEEERRKLEKIEPPAQYDAIVPSSLNTTVRSRRGRHTTDKNGVEAVLDQQYSKITEKILSMHRKGNRRSPTPDAREGNEEENATLSFWFIGAFALICCHLWGNFIFTLVASMAAHSNYPGGNAMANLTNHIQSFDLVKHRGRLEPKEIGVHVCNLAAQTGVTRFLELQGVVYDKSPSLEQVANKSSLSVTTKAIYPMTKDFSPLKLVYVILENVDVQFLSQYCSSFASRAKKSPSLVVPAKSDVCNFGDKIRNCKIFDIINGFNGIDFGFGSRNINIRTLPVLWVFRCLKPPGN